MFFFYTPPPESPVSDPASRTAPLTERPDPALPPSTPLDLSAINSISQTTCLS